jgi:hypothetical protein
LGQGLRSAGSAGPALRRSRRTSRMPRRSFALHSTLRASVALGAGRSSASGQGLRSAGSAGPALRRSRRTSRVPRRSFALHSTLRASVALGAGRSSASGQGLRSAGSAGPALRRSRRTSRVPVRSVELHSTLRALDRLSLSARRRRVRVPVLPASRASDALRCRASAAVGRARPASPIARPKTAGGRFRCPPGAARAPSTSG